MTAIYHARPMDLHAPGEHCNNYDCTAVVMKHEHDARLAEAEAHIAHADKMAYFPGCRYCDQELSSQRRSALSTVSGPAPTVDGSS